MFHADTIATWAICLADVLASPPKPRGLGAFARTLRLPEDPTAPAGQQPGLYDPASHPAQYEILLAFADGGFYEFVQLGPIQDGKTWAGEIVPMLYALIELRRSVVYAGPTREFIDEQMASKVLPSIEGSGLGRYLPDRGRGSSGGQGPSMLFTTGARLFLRGAGGANEAGQAGISAPYVFLEERDSIRSRWAELLFGRSESYDTAARRVSNSTLKLDEAGKSPTWQVYEGSTANRLWFQCRACVASDHASGGWQPFEWDRVTYDGADDATAAASVRLVCRHCAHPMTDVERKQALGHHRLVGRGQAVAKDGAITGDRPASSVWGLRWTSLDSPLKSLGMLAVKHRLAVHRRDAYGDHEPLRQFHRDQLAAPYRDDVEGLDGVKAISREYLAARSQAHGWSAAIPERDELGLYSRHLAAWPEAAEFAVVAVDVQENRCYWSIIAGDASARTWDVAWGYEFATKAQEPLDEAELHTVLDRIDELAHALALDAAVPLVFRAVDVGYRQSDLANWLRGHAAWLPVAGAGDDVAGTLRKANRPGDLPGVIYRVKPDGWTLPSTQLLHMVDADRMKREAQAMFLRASGSVGAAHLPQGVRANDSYIKHLCGEIYDDQRRKWIRQPGRHDFLDCRCYSVAGIRLHLDLARRQTALDEARARAQTRPAAPAPAGGNVW